MSQQKDAANNNNPKNSNNNNQKKVNNKSKTKVNKHPEDKRNSVGGEAQKPQATKTPAPKPATESAARPNANRRAAGSNWNAQRVAAAPKQEVQAENSVNNATATQATAPTKSARMRMKRKAMRNKYVAMDCEMVGVGAGGLEDMVARVSIVNRQGEVLLDKFVKPREAVTDYRTSVSGIRPRDIERGEEFDEVQDEVLEILQGKVLVGHALSKDLSVLHIKHPYVNTRDTSRYKPLCQLFSNGGTPSLKRLSKAILGQEIQIGEHNSVEDARAAMSIYNRLSSDWEKYIERRRR